MAKTCDALGKHVTTTEQLWYISLFSLQFTEGSCPTILFVALTIQRAEMPQ